jgi:hypothetical protein
MERLKRKCIYALALFLAKSRIAAFKQSIVNMPLLMRKDLANELYLWGIDRVLQPIDLYSQCLRRYVSNFCDSTDDRINDYLLTQQMTWRIFSEMCDRIDEEWKQLVESFDRKLYSKWMKCQSENAEMMRQLSVSISGTYIYLTVFCFF